MHMWSRELDHIEGDELYKYESDHMRASQFVSGRWLGALNECDARCSAYRAHCISIIHTVITMCAIFAVIARHGGHVNFKRHGKRLRSLRDLAVRQSAKQRHRGPDHTGVAEVPSAGVVMVQERLSIVGVKTGDQPHQSADGSVLLTSNGEIYNYLQIAADLRRRRGGAAYVPRSDCDVILGLYEEMGPALLQHIKGMFAFVLYDAKTGQLLVARDPIGIIPLYRGVDADGNMWFASEMKCLVDVCTSVEVFPPGRSLFGTLDNLQETSFYEPAWLTEVPAAQPVDLRRLEELLVAAVRTHLHCDATVPFGALLSGGVDSSLVASIATRILRESDPAARLKTFSVGLRDAPDFKYSRMVADYLNCDHQEIVFEIEDALDCIREIIYHIETFDVTTVRCSIPMTILARAIKAQGIKMILSGEGADEIFGGYLYFFNAPNAADFHRELVHRVRALHLSDCQRANKSMMAYGIEPRVPFLDTDFVQYTMAIDPADKMPSRGEPAVIEKRILRAAFANGYLPDEVLWRQKEQFSDGVGYSWIDTIRATAAAQIDDGEFAKASVLFPENTPTTKEQFYYRAVFEELFPGEGCLRTVQRWIPRLDWGCSEDPSGRAQKTHTAAY